MNFIHKRVQITIYNYPRFLEEMKSQSYHLSEYFIRRFVHFIMNSLEGEYFMKMKQKICISAFVILLAGLAGFWFVPKHFGNSVDPAVVDHINVFDGDTAVGFTIDAPDEIKQIVENIQNTPMKKKGISMRRTGYGFSISYVDENENEIVPIFFLNSEDSIQKTPFLYTCEGELCFDYLKFLEEQYLENAESFGYAVTQR